MLPYAAYGKSCHHRVRPGGLLTTTTIVENFPGFPEGVDGYELMTRMQKQAERFGAKASFGIVDAADFSRRPFTLVVDGEPVAAQTVIIATGASHKHLGVPGEHELENQGVTYCATCDGALPGFRNQPLVVVGGGDSACEEALYLTRFGSEIFLVHRRDGLRASRIMSERTLAHPKIKPVWNSVVTEVLDVQQAKVTGVKLKHLPTGAESALPCAGVFIAIGQVPNTDLFQRQITTDENGFIVPQQGTMTNVAGVFVAGDCADHVYRQAITAAGTGCAGREHLCRPAVLAMSCAAAALFAAEAAGYRADGLEAAAAGVWLEYGPTQLVRCKYNI